MRRVRYLIIVLCAAVCSAAETEPASIGGPAPGFAGVHWLIGGEEPKPGSERTQVVIFWACNDGADQPALAHVTELAKQARVVLLADGLEAESDDLKTKLSSIPDQGVADGDVRARWLGSEESPLPTAVVIGADGIMVWRGRPNGLAAALAREIAHQFDRAMLVNCTKYHHDLRDLLDAQSENGDDKLEQALELTTKILAIDALDEEAIHIRLDLCRHLNKRDDFRKTLSDIPLDRLPGDVANGLAWERITDEDLSWRCPELALKLAEHACAAQPEEAAHQDTYARVLYALSLIDDAISAQIHAVSLAPDDEDIRATLDYYHEIAALRDVRLHKTELPH